MEMHQQIPAEIQNIKFQENPFGGSRVVHADGRVDMTRLFLSRYSLGERAYKTIRSVRSKQGGGGHSLQNTQQRKCLRQPNTPRSDHFQYRNFSVISNFFTLR
jgi:hypothetical protein